MKENWLTDDLETLATALWRELGRGVREAKAPFHTPVLATLTPHGPEPRVVVLREADAVNRRLRCHTDVRSRKVAEIAAQPAVSWLFYDAAQKIQIRAGGMAQVHHLDDLAARAWTDSRLSSRRCYVIADAPGTVVDAPKSGLPKHLTGRIPTLAESAAGWENFAVVVAEITRLDWLYLDAHGHRRAQFVWDGADWRGTWVIP